MSTHRVTMTTTAHGDDEAHRTGCADLKRGHRADRTHDLGEFDTRVDVAADWWADQIDENNATAEEYVSAIHFAPCLDSLPTK